MSVKDILKIIDELCMLIVLNHLDAETLQSDIDMLRDMIETIEQNV